VVLQAVAVHHQTATHLLDQVLDQAQIAIRLMDTLHDHSLVDLLRDQEEDTRLEVLRLVGFRRVRGL